MAKSKRVKRDYEFYRSALLGTQDRVGELTLSLRSVAVGFSAPDGYNLHDLKAGRWTPAQKARVTRYLRELHDMTAQEKIVIRTRSPSRLRQAQQLGGHKPGYKFKVAFVPGTAESVPVWNDDGSLSIQERGYCKDSGLFNSVALARNADKEIARVINLPKLRKAQFFGIKAGTNIIMGEMPDRHFVFQKVKKLMSDYDGREALPDGSGNTGDKPRSHHWRQWLHGVQGYTFRGEESLYKGLARETRANMVLQRRRAAARKKEARRIARGKK